MALQGTLSLDTRPFDEALRSAVATAGKFGDTITVQATKSQAALTRMIKSFSGETLHKEAMTMAAAIERVGGVGKLTEKELARVSATINEVVAKYRAMGQAVPDSIAKVSKGIQDLGLSTDDAHQKTGGFFKSLAGSVAIGTLVASALTSAARSAVQMARDFFRSADALVSLSDKTGLSIEYLQKLEYAATQSGTSLDSMTSAITMMQDRLGGGDKGVIRAVKALGLSFDELRAARPEQAFDQIMRALGAVEDVNARVAMSRDIFGRAGADVLRMADNYGTLIDKAERLGLVIDEQAIRAAEELGDTFETLMQQGKVLLAQALEPMIPLLIDLANWATRAAPALGQTLARAVSRLVEEFLILKATLLDLRVNWLKLNELIARGSFRTLEAMQYRGELEAVKKEHAALMRQIQDSAGRRQEGIFGEYGPHLREAGSAAEAAATAFFKYDRATEKAAKTTEKLADELAKLDAWFEQVRQGSLTGPLAGSLAGGVPWASRSDFQRGTLNMFAPNAPGVLAPQMGGTWGGFTGQQQGVTPFNPFAGMAEPGFWSKAFGGNFGSQMTSTILSAFTGGGDVGKSIGGLIGGNLMGELGKTVGKLGGKVMGAIGGALGPIGGLLGGLMGGLVDKLFGPSQAEQTKRLRDEWLKGVDDLKALERQAALAGFNMDRIFEARKVKDFEQAVKDLEESLKNWQRQLEAIKATASGLNTWAQGLQTSLKDVTTLSAGMQGELQALGNLTLATFVNMVRHTGDLIGALNAIGPTLGVLIAEMGRFGIAIEGPLAGLTQLWQFGQDNPELFQRIQGLTQALQGLTEAGWISEGMFRDFGTAAINIYNDLLARGLDANQALVAMQPTLQTMWELWKKNGWAVDEATQALLENAEQQGIVGEQMKSWNEKVLDLLGLIAKALGADIPEAAKKGAQEISDAYGSIELPDFGDFRLPSAGGELAEVPGYQHGSGGVRDFRSGTLAMLHGREAVLTESQLQSLLEGRNGGATVTITINALDTQSVRTAVEQEIAPQLVEVLRQNVRGLRTDTQYALGVR